MRQMLSDAKTFVYFQVRTGRGWNDMRQMQRRSQYCGSAPSPLDDTAPLFFEGSDRPFNWPLKDRIYENP
jgi:hypothetical protein